MYLFGHTHSQHTQHSALTMPLDMVELQAIQYECLAEDIDLDFEKMKLWTEEHARTYFESGGVDEPSVADSVDEPSITASIAAIRPAPTGPLGRKPRVVLLHGTATNEAILKIQLAPLLRQVPPPQPAPPAPPAQVGPTPSPHHSTTILSTPPRTT